MTGYFILVQLPAMTHTACSGLVTSGGFTITLSLYTGRAALIF